MLIRSVTSVGMPLKRSLVGGVEKGADLSYHVFGRFSQVIGKKHARGHTNAGKGNLGRRRHVFPYGANRQ